VRADIGALAAEAEKGHEHDPGADRRPAAAAALPAHGARAPGMAREDAERREHGGRGADRGVARAMEGGVERIAEGAGQQDHEPAETSAEELRDQYARSRAEREVAQQVVEIDMETERRDRSPPCAVLDQAGLGRADLEPVDRPRMRARRGKEEQEHGAIGERPFDPVQSRSARAQRSPRQRVLAGIAGKLMPGPCRLERRDVERGGTLGHDQPAADADRSEHERLLLGSSAGTGPAHLDQFRRSIVCQAAASGAARDAPVGCQ
jgi:hypothetical protein